MRTHRGRVVYNRSKHEFSPRDLLRILKILNPKPVTWWEGIGIKLSDDILYEAILLINTVSLVMIRLGADEIMRLALLELTNIIDTLIPPKRAPAAPKKGDPGPPRKRPTAKEA